VKHLGFAGRSEDGCIVVFCEYLVSPVMELPGRCQGGGDLVNAPVQMGNDIRYIGGLISEYRFQLRCRTTLLVVRHELKEETHPSDKQILELRLRRSVMRCHLFNYMFMDAERIDVVQRSIDFRGGPFHPWPVGRFEFGWDRLKRSVIVGTPSRERCGRTYRG
jgi:hypothetical protein